MKETQLAQTIKIKGLGKVITGTTPPTGNKEFFNGKYLFIKPSDISEDQRYIFETESTLSDVGYEYQKLKVLPKNSICVVCIGTIGKKMCLTSQTSFTNQQLNSIVVNTSRVSASNFVALDTDKSLKLHLNINFSFKIGRIVVND